tara:strand:+ start:54 stop:629 length:576 start_codon:yes stop_codon:yes gene_type:complete
MKYKQTKLITYTDKKIKDDSWNVEDECIYNAYNFLMYALDKRLQRKNDKATADNPFIDTEATNQESLLKYFAVLINDTLEKVETDKSKWNLNYIKQKIDADYVHNFLSQTNTVIYELNNKDHVLTADAIKRNEYQAEARRQQEEKERMLQKAVKQAKAEILREQEEAKELEEAEEEAVSNQIVFPLKNYGK